MAHGSSREHTMAATGTQETETASLMGDDERRTAYLNRRREAEEALERELESGRRVRRQREAEAEQKWPCIKCGEADAAKNLKSLLVRFSRMKTRWTSQTPGSIGRAG